MNNLILLVEDNPVEQEKAKSLLLQEGFRVAIASTLYDADRFFTQLKGKLVGVITDLHIPDPKRSADKSEKPRGLAVVVKVVRAKLPIVICSDINHHGAEYVKDIIDFISSHPDCSTRVPFIMDGKNWQRAIEELMILIKEGRK